MADTPSPGSSPAPTLQEFYKDIEDSGGLFDGMSRDVKEPEWSPQTAEEECNLGPPLVNYEGENKGVLKSKHPIVINEWVRLIKFRQFYKRIILQCSFS